MLYRRKTQDVDAIFDQDEKKYLVRMPAGAIVKIGQADFENEYEPLHEFHHIRTGQVEALPIPRVHVPPLKDFDPAAITEVLCFSCGIEISPSKVDKNGNCAKCAKTFRDPKIAVADAPLEGADKPDEPEDATILFCEECEQPFMPKSRGQTLCPGCLRGGGQ